MKVPLHLQTNAAGAATELRLVKLAAEDSAGRARSALRDPPQDCWVVRHEGLILRGQATDLPASVREVTEASSRGPGVFEFWQSLGARVEYEYERQGNFYVCVQDGVELQVFVFDLKRNGAVLKPGFLLEATAMAADKELVTASAKALAAFAHKLLPHVEIRRADPR